MTLFFPVLMFKHIILLDGHDERSLDSFLFACFCFFKILDNTTCWWVSGGRGWEIRVVWVKIYTTSPESKLVLSNWLSLLDEQLREARTSVYKETCTSVFITQWLKRRKQKKEIIQVFITREKTNINKFIHKFNLIW